MHGLTKKKSYGIKAPKKTYADIRMPNAGRPILPRLEVPHSQSEIYTYPSFDNVNGAETQGPDVQLGPPRRHSVDQLPSASLVARTINEDRRARRHSPWLPMAPYVSSTPSSPTSTTSPGTRAALQSLASMTPRGPPDFMTMAKDHMGPGTADLGADGRVAYSVASLPVSSSPPNAMYYSSGTTWVQQAAVAPSPISSAPSPTHTVSSTSTVSDASRLRTSPPTPQLMSGSEYSYGSSPPSSTATTPPSISAPVGESLEDQPFVVPPEYEAQVNASFQEAVMSGEIQRNMTAATGYSSATPTMSTPSYTPTIAAHVRHDQTYYPPPTPPPHVMAAQETAYPMYQPAGYSNGEYVIGTNGSAHGVWQYPTGETYMSAQPEYNHAHGQWYSS